VGRVRGMTATAYAATGLLVTVLAGAGLAQTAATAMVRGRVLDPQQRPVPGARVVATASATGWAREASTDAAGQYVLPDLPPGGFVVSITAGGFAPQRFEAATLRVGQVLDLDAELTVAGVREDVVVDAAGTGLVDTARSVVDAVITAPNIDRLPLNGRNFMELALLVPGNGPAPNFDPTKTNSVVVSSAGQLGRGGNITIDGMDNNDDVVGGPLLNIVQEGVQEFQIATSRFAADLGRSAGSAINVITRSGGDVLHGSGSLFFRDDSLQAFPPLADRSAEAPPFDRQQFSVSAGGPLRKGSIFAFGAFEYRNQDGALLVGTRDTAARTIRRSFAPAPLDDLLGLGRVDWRLADTDQLLFRYSGQDAEDVAGSGGDRPIASASQRQRARNKYHSGLATWTRVLSSRSVNSFSFSVSDFDNAIVSLSAGPQYTFPSIEDGSSFRVPQSTVQRRWQFADTLSHSLGAHTLRAGGEVQLVRAAFGLGVFREGRVELVQDFPEFDANGDGRVDDNDLLFAVTLRSGRPDQDLSLPDTNNTHAAFFIQDDWRVRPNLTLNLGLRYELDTDVKNVSRYDEINPIVRGFLQGDRGRDLDNWGPRVGFNWSTPRGGTSVHGGYGIYFDRITLQIQSLERGLDGRALPVEVRAGNVFFMGPTGFPPFAPNLSNPFTGFILPGAGASGINIIDNSMQNPQTQQFNLGVEHQIGDAWRIRVDGVHALGTHFIIGRDAGVVFNPVVGGPDRVVNLESSARTHYNALLVGVERRLTRGLGVRASYALSKAENYANDDQIPFSNGPLDPSNLRGEFGPTPNDQRHRFTLAASWQAPAGFSLSTIWTLASGVPMDILLPSGRSRIPELERNAGGRRFTSAGELNDYLRDLNARGGVAGQPMPLVASGAKFNDRFDSLDLRVTRPLTLRRGLTIEPMLEVFNAFNVANFLGSSNVNYSGFSNALVRDSEDPSSPGFLTSSRFGRPVSTAGGVFGSGGPRAAQVAVRVKF
jgi:Carboxypeptidase regulatory-like domain/TonB dependent receptor